MFKKSCLALTVLAVCNSFVVAQANTTEFNDPNKSYVGKDVSMFGSSITAKDITITVDQNNHGIQAYGTHTLNATGDISITGKTHGILGPNDEDAPIVSITSGSEVKISGAWAIMVNNNTQLDIKGKKITLRGGNGISANSSKAVNLVSDQVDIVGSEKHGISSSGSGGIQIKTTDLYIKGGSQNAINALHGAIQLTTTGNTIIDGDILAQNESAKVTASFNNANSSLTGAVLTQKGQTDLTFKDQAKWTATGDSKVTNLTLNNATVELNGHAVTTDKLADQANATIVQDVGADGKQMGSFTVANKPTDAKLTLAFVQNADVVNSDIVKNGAQSITMGGSAVENLTVAPVKAGLVAPETIFDASGKVTTQGTNEMMFDTLQLVSMSSLTMNRILDSDLRQRMGDLRQSKGTHGVWARYDGGRLSGENSFETDFHTLQVGVDTVPTADNVRFGLAASYTKGDSEYTRGESDMDAFSLSAYGTWMAESGLYTDVVARLTKANNDLTVDRHFTGSVDSIALGLSGELGWRFNVTDRAYLEPQAEFTYTYIDGDKFSLSHEKTQANYELDAFDSFIARAGLMAGYTCPNNKGDIYVRASAVHEFMGDAKLHGVIGQTRNTEMIDGKDTWFEYGIGGNLNLTPNTYLWIDLERTAGATIETDYRATIGARYVF